MTLRAKLPRLLLALAIFAGTSWLLFHRDKFEVGTFEHSIRTLGICAPAAHVGLFALGTVLFVPGALFALAGGALFGPVWGTLLNLAGATLGASAAFLLARYIAADAVRRQAPDSLERIIKGAEAEGWRFVVLTRLIPLIPFNLLNYALGLTRIPLAVYMLASLISMAPAALAYTWLGHAGRMGLAGDTAAIHYGLLGLALLAAVMLLPPLLRRWSRKKTRWLEVGELVPRLGPPEAITVIDVRGPDEFSGPLGHIQGARNLPLPELQPRLQELRGLAEVPVVLVCKTDKRSQRAAAVLDAAGFRNVAVLRGGMLRWVEARLPVATC